MIGNVFDYTWLEKILSVFLMKICDDKKNTTGKKHVVDINKSGIVFVLASIFSLILN
jgi:hypothetical protein